MTKGQQISKQIYEVIISALTFRAEILAIFRSFFGRNSDFINFGLDHELRTPSEDINQRNLKICDWNLIFGRAVKAISSPGVRSPCPALIATENP
jgi:hypothetical protein